MTNPITDTSKDAVGKLRLYTDWPYTSHDTLVLDSELVRISAQDLADVVQVCDTLQATVNEMREALEIAMEFIDDQFASVEAQALEGEHVYKEARPVWSAICNSLAKQEQDNE